MPRCAGFELGIWRALTESLLFGVFFYGSKNATMPNLIFLKKSDVDYDAAQARTAAANEFVSNRRMAVIREELEFHAFLREKRIAERDEAIAFLSGNYEHFGVKNQILNYQSVDEIFRYCLFKTNEEIQNPLLVEGLKIKVGFNPKRIAERSDEIRKMLHELPKEFMQGDGNGGWSFLNMVTDKNGNQWADSHESVDKLVVIGLASGHLKLLLSRELWVLCPGGMPYYCVL